MAITKTYSDTFASAASVANEDIIVVQQGTGSDLSQMKKASVGDIRKPLNDRIDNLNVAEIGASGTFIQAISQSSGIISASSVSFATGIGNSGNPPVAPTVDAVYNYITGELNNGGRIANKIDEKIGSLTAPSKGSDGNYIKLISETSGVINATTQAFEAELSNTTANAPTSKAVKDYVDNKVSSLAANVGGNDKLVTSVTQSDGKISGTTINIDSSLSSSASAIPTAKAVYDKFASLASSVGGSGKLVTSVTQSDGKISGTTIDIATGIENNPNKIPTAKAVYDANQGAIYAALSALDYEAGADGCYIKSIEQEDGQVSVGLQTFAGSVTANDASNTPHAKAVYEHVASAASSIYETIGGMTGSAGTAGSFLQGFTQASGVVTMTTKAFSTNSFATTGLTGLATSGATDTAPTEKAVAQGLETLNDRVNATNNTISAMDWSSTASSAGKFIGTVSQTDGKISATLTDFLTDIPATTGDDGKVAPSANAVRAAINALTVAQTGADGYYLKTIKEDNGKISATAQDFDTTVGPASGSGAATDKNAPTSKAVRTAIDKAKEEILQESEAMVYMGTVNSKDAIASIASAASRPAGHLYDSGDVYMSNADFTLTGTSGISGDAKYQVYDGDMIIVKADSASYNENNFDIIGGSDKTVLYGSTAAAVNGNFVAFNSTSGRSVVDSGWNATKIIAQVSSSAEFADEAASWASYAASSAEFADAEVVPYRIAASCEASKAEEYANNANTAKGNAESYAAQALVAKGNAEAYAVDANNAKTAATTYAAQALSAKNTIATYNTAGVLTTGYQYDALQALKATTGYEKNAGDAKANAVESANQAESYSNSALDSKTAATTYAAQALVAKGNAESYAADANTAKGNAESYAAQALSAKGNAESYAADANTAKGNAESYAADANTAKGNAESYAAQALSAKGNAESYAAQALSAKNTIATYNTAGTLTTGYQYDALQALTATTGYENNALVAKNNAEAYAASANLEGIKNAAEAAAGSASNSATEASNQACLASLSAIAAATAATTAVTTFACEASAALESEVTRATDAESNLTTAISNEVTRATASESSLATAISNEVTRATEAEANLAASIPSIPDISVTDTQTGNVVSSISASGHALTLSRINAITSETTLSTAAGTGTGNVISSIAVDGHKITVNKEVTVTDYTDATTSTRGLVNTSSQSFAGNKTLYNSTFTVQQSTGGVYSRIASNNIRVYGSTSQYTDLGNSSLSIRGTSGGEIDFYYGTGSRFWRQKINSSGQLEFTYV